MGPTKEWSLPEIQINGKYKEQAWIMFSSIIPNVWIITVMKTGKKNNDFMTVESRQKQEETA